MIWARRELVRRELPFTARFGLKELSADDGMGPVDSVPTGDDWVVVQGVVDLAVIQPEEIWLLDFKTDRVTDQTVAAKVREYEPQLRLYARALERIYRRPVVHAWLHFLEGGRTESVSKDDAGRFPSFAADAPDRRQYGPSV